MPGDAFRRGDGGTVVRDAGFVAATAVGTDADTNEKTLQSFTLPANTLHASAHSLLRIHAQGSFAANANTKTARLKFGSTLVATLTGAFNNGIWVLDAFIAGIAAAQSIYVSGRVTIASAIDFQADAGRAAGAEDGTTALTITVTGENGTAAADDVVCDFMTVEYLTNLS